MGSRRFTYYTKLLNLDQRKPMSNVSLYLSITPVESLSLGLRTRDPSNQRKFLNEALTGGGHVRGIVKDRYAQLPQEGEAEGGSASKQADMSEAARMRSGRGGACLSCGRGSRDPLTPASHTPTGAVVGPRQPTAPALTPFQIRRPDGPPARLPAGPAAHLLVADDGGRQGVEA